MVLEVFRHLFASIQTCLKLSVSDVTSHDDSTLQVDTCADWILRELSANCLNTVVEVDLDALSALARTTKFFRDKLRRIRVHHLKEDTVLCNLTLDVAVGRTAHAHTDRTACSMTWKTDHADVVCQVLAAELGTQTNLVSLLQEFFLKVDVAESASGLVASSRQSVVVFD